MPQIRFNWIDILFVTLIIRISYIGFKTGVLAESFRSLGLVAAFIISFANYTRLNDFLVTKTKCSGTNLEIISFIFLFVAVLFIFKVLATLVSKTMVSGPSKVLGLFLGIARGIILVSLIYMLFVNSPFGYLSRVTKERTLLGQFVSDIPSAIYKTCVNFYPCKLIETPLVKKIES